jgi:hypothetical protein
MRGLLDRILTALDAYADSEHREQSTTSTSAAPSDSSTTDLAAASPNSQEKPE